MIFGGCIGEYGDVAGFFDDFLAFAGEDPVDEGLDVGILSSGGDGIDLFGDGVLFGENRVSGGGNAVDGEQFDFAVFDHFGGEEAERVADGVGKVSIFCDLSDDAAHEECDVFFGSGGEWFAIHESDEGGLAAAARGALKGADGCVLAADFFPVGDFSGVNVLDLLHGQAIDGVFAVYEEYEGFSGDGSQRKLGAKLCALLVVRGGCEDQVCFTVLESFVCLRGFGHSDQAVVRGVGSGGIDGFNEGCVDGVEGGGAVECGEGRLELEGGGMV